MHQRTQLHEALLNGPQVQALYAPAGWGKTAWLEEMARSDLRVVRVSLGSTEGHFSLFTEAISQGLKRAFPGSAIGAVRVLRSSHTLEGDVVTLLERVREALAADTLYLALDEVEQLPQGEVSQAIKTLIGRPPAGVRILLVGRVPLGHLGEGAAKLGTCQDLALDEDAIAQLIQLEAATQHLPPLSATDLKHLASVVLDETGGWPALVAARLRVGLTLTVSETELSSAFKPVVDEALRSESSESRYILDIASVLPPFETDFLQALLANEVPGEPDARRRLIRLEPALVEKNLGVLARAGVIQAQGDGRWSVLSGVRRALSVQFATRDRAGWQETQRRAAELISQREELPGPILADLFTQAQERERLLAVLAQHGSRFELDIAEKGDDIRVLRWTEALAGLVLPYWVHVLAGLSHARLGHLVAAREHMDKARDRLTRERTEGDWQFTARMAEGYAISARKRGDFVDSRSFLTRGLDRLERVKQHVHSPTEQAVYQALERRLKLALARLSLENGSFEKSREALWAARAVWRPYAPHDLRVLELDMALMTLAASAGDVQALKTLRQDIDDPRAEVLAVFERHLHTGKVSEALAELQALNLQQDTALSLRDLLVARLSGSPDLVKEALERIRSRSDGASLWLSKEVELRREALREGQLKQPEGAEGWLSALVLELNAKGPGRQLDAARSAYRRYGARYDEVRLWLVAAAALSRRVDDGDGETEEVAKAVDALVESAKYSGFNMPWEYAGRGEVDPERRIRTILVAGLRQGNEATRDVCKQELERMGVDPRTVSGSVVRQRGTPNLSRRFIATHGAPFVLLTRTTSQGLSASDYQQMIASKGTGTFTVCVPDNLVLNYGKVVSLGQKRVMMPLLLHLMRHPDNAFSMLDLAREIWESPDLTATVQTKVKVAISRLRALLGKNRNYIATTRKQEDGESVVAYQLAAQLPFQIIETAQNA